MNPFKPKNNKLLPSDEGRCQDRKCLDGGFEK